MPDAGGLLQPAAADTVDGPAVYALDTDTNVPDEGASDMTIIKGDKVSYRTPNMPRSFRSHGKVIEVRTVTACRVLRADGTGQTIIPELDASRELRNEADE